MEDINKILIAVAVFAPLRQVFHYLPPPGISTVDIVPGTRIIIPFGRQQKIGLILSLEDSTAIPANRLKQAIRIVDKKPVWPDSIFRLVTWAASYYHYPIGEAIATALPVLLRKGDELDDQLTVLRLTEAGLQTQIEDLNRAPAQRALLLQLQANPAGLSKPELRGRDISTGVIRALIDKGITAWQTVTSDQIPWNRALLQIRQSAIHPGTEQAAAIASVINSGPTCHLLFGITGSGKTEVYLQVIAHELAHGRQALIIVPEIGLTPQIISRFRDRFNVPVEVLHSSLTDRERMKAWRNARSGVAPIVIGTRSAIFTPLRTPGVIVVDEEHDGSFKQTDGLRYSARDLAVMRGQLESVPVILGSATPSLQSLQNALTGRYQLSRLTARTGDALPPVFSIIDSSHQPLSDGFSRPLINEIRTTLAAGNQVLVFLNRRGYAPVLFCTGCNTISNCNRCDARFTLHRNRNSLICHHCGSEQRVPTTCVECGGKELLPLGQGTERVEDTLRTNFPDTRIIRVDRDTTTRKDAMENLLGQISDRKPTILVGTQLLAKGHHLPGVTLVAVLDADGAFFSADYKAIEHLGQLLLQVGGRAGREDRPGKVMIQSQFPDHPGFGMLFNEGYEVFGSAQLVERQNYHLPPFSYQALIRAEATDRQQPWDFLQSIAAQQRRTPLTCELAGPIPALMEKRAGRYRALLLVSSASRRQRAATLRQLLVVAEQNPLSKKVRWSIDVDPYDLF